MLKTVHIIDYGSGNLMSVSRALTHVGAQVVISSKSEDIRNAAGLVLPGVGAFGDVASRIRRLDLFEPIIKYMSSGRPFLGICVGMQLLFEKSFEFGEHEGFGVIAGSVRRIPTSDAGREVRKIPHIGWSPLEMHGASGRWANTIMDGIEIGESAYYVHSYSGIPRDENVILSRSDYLGYPVCGSVRLGNIYGCQFHPEKSGEVGLRILDNFVGII